MRVDVKFGAKTHSIEVPSEDATLGQLKELIREATGVLPAMQKLLGKPGLQTKPDDTPLSALGIKDKAKLMLIGSTAEDVVKANAPTSQAEKEAEDGQEKLMRSLSYNFWAFAPFAGLLGDPYVAGKGHPLEGGSSLMALLSLDVILSRINTLGASASNPFASSAKLLNVMGTEASQQVSHRFLKTITTEHRVAIQKAHAVLRTCFKFNMEVGEGKFPDNVLGAVDKVSRAITDLPKGEWLMLPSGWLGMRSYNVMFLLIHRVAPAVWDLVVVNKGTEGSEYHPRWQTAEKTRGCGFLKFDNVAQERLTDRTFWLLNLALWMNRDDPSDRSEFVRAEVFYDVLLPWLVEKDPKSDKLRRYATEMLLQGGGGGGDASSTALTEHRQHQETSSVEVVGDTTLAGPGTDAHSPYSPFVMAHGGSLPCSASSAIKSAVAAFCFLLEQYGGMTREEIKQVKYALKYEYFLRAAEDLAMCADRYLTGVTGTTAAASARPATPKPDDAAAVDLQALSAATKKMKEAAGLTGGKAKSNGMTFPQILAEAKKENVIFKTAQNIILQPNHFTGKMVIMYTGTLAVPGVKKFASLFSDTAAAITRRVKDAANGSAGANSTSRALPEVEFLMLSCDQTRETYEEHASMFTFPRAAGPCLDLFRALDINQAPEVFVFTPDGALLHRQGVRAVREDPDAEQFPNGPWKGTAPLSATDVKMLAIGAAQITHHTKKRFDQQALNAQDVAHVVALVHATLEVVAALPKDNVHTITKAKKSTAALAEDAEALGLNATLSHPISVKAAAQFNNADLLPSVSVAQYYGKPYRTSVPALPDICDFTPATSYPELSSILKRSKGIVETLWARASHSGTASRVAVQMHIIEFVTWVFSTMVPVPLPPSHIEGGGVTGGDILIPPEEQACTAAFYHTGAFPTPHEGSAEEDMQMELMEAIYYLMLSLANAWQAVENPSRSFDAERCLVAMDMLLVFDAIARQTKGSLKVQMLAMLLGTEGGYYPSTSLGKQTISFTRVAATLELTRPALLPIRSAMLRYMQYQQQNLKHELFDLRMPDKLEIRKASTTVTFLRTMLDNCGYSLEESGSMMGQNASEMEKLMEWLCNSRTPLAREHREFGLYRDMVLLAKFLGTLEMRDAQLLHRRKEMDPLASWRISFEEDAPGRQMSAGWRTRPAPPKWECVMVRGRDMDIADLIVKGFGDREVMYGEGLSLQSPIDVSRLIEVDHPTEDDVLHAKTMPTFGGTMSPEESEVLLSCLTTPYVRIPLVLDFFSSQDRNTYLFVPEVQAALRAVLFEPAAYVSPERLRLADPRSVPMRLNAQQRAEIELRILRGDHSKQDHEECLGTTYGLLLNELAHAPAAVLSPLRRILESVSELGPSSVYSANASYVLYVVGLLCDVLAYCRFVVECELAAEEPLALVEEYHNHLVNYLHGQVVPLMEEWLCEAEVNTDTPTQCVIYAYKSMVDRSLWKGLLSVKSLVISATGSASPTAPTPKALAQDRNPESMDPPYRTSAVHSQHQQQQQQRSRQEEAERHLIGLLQDCSFVRARHGFGMGMQRTQLAAQEGDNLLTPEEKMLRFLQAQGLDTSNVSQQMLEQGKQLMMSGGRRRAVFVQIRSRFYNDTVRVPNLFHSDPTSTTESRALKLPPADVPENILFAYLLQDHLTITRLLDGQTPEGRGAIFQKVVQAVLRDRSAGDEDGDKDSETGGASRAPGIGLARRQGSFSRSTSVSTRASAVNLDQLGGGSSLSDPQSADISSVEKWTVDAPGVYRGPAASGLLFHVQTCELFWRNDELKPVPDSMSHFTDFENILGKEILQCGLVSRHEHRHWVHIVGTPYDVIEWTAPPELADQGVHSPVVLEGELPAEPVTRCVFEGVTYDRPLSIDEEDPWPVKAERWATEMVRQVLQRAFSGGMKFQPLAAALPSASDDEGGDEERTRAPASSGATVEVDEMRFIMNDGPQYENEEDRATWKEIVCYRYPQPHFDVFNLVPHARKMYRSLVFSTNQRYCLHSLALLSQQRTRESLAVSAFQAGELKRRIQRESTLEIHRFNDHVNGREVYIPARLLQGLIPSALLESFFFWQGEDDVIRGYPLSDESSDASVLAGGQETTDAPQASKTNIGADDVKDGVDKEKKKQQNTEMLDHWFNYAVEIYLGGSRGTRRNEARHGGTLTVVRREDKTYTLIHPRTKKDRAFLSRATEAATEAPAAGDNEEDADLQHALRQSEVSLLHAALPHLSQGVCETLLLRHSGDIAGAIQWATDPAHQEELQMLQQQMAETTPPPMAAPAAAAMTGNEVDGAPRNDRILVNLLRCRRLSRLLEMFTNLEDPSHMMVWGRPVEESSAAVGGDGSGVEALTVREFSTGKQVVVESIELPRLRARFYTATDGASPRLRLYLADQPGWRVAEADDVTSDAHRTALEALRDPFQQCLVLCNSTHEVAFMVPNHDFTPMDVANDPFNALLLFDRSSYTWRESVPSPYYLYNVHTSNAFLLPATLSASLYYAVMLCATQHYSSALRTLESCYTDSPFSPEEAYMFALFERTVGDAFPDAHAVRLKLAHAVQYSKNEYQWSLPQELTGYLAKMRHVSADCRLKRSEVLDLLKRCNRAVPIVRSQLELYAGLLSHQSKSSEHTETAEVTIKTVSMDRCGFPWERLLLYPWDKVSPQKLKRVTYSSPQPDKLSEGKLVQFIFTDELLADEESGANAKRGFYFLYSMKKGDLKPMLFGNNVSVAFSQLMGRWFHLRHARWGREEQQNGETEMAPSWCATVLQLMELFPSADWPAPVGVNERYTMARGVNLVSGGGAGGGSGGMNWDEERQQRHSTIPDLFNKMNTVARDLFTVSSVTNAIRSARSQSQQRTPEARNITVSMFDHIIPRVLPHNTAMGSLELQESSFAMEYFSNGSAEQRARTLAALCTEPLSELGFATTGLISVLEPDLEKDRSAEGKDKRARHATSTTASPTTEVSTETGSRLPFDIREHPLARAPLAQNMLDRLEEDSARFAEQQKGTTRYAFVALGRPQLDTILGSKANNNDGGAAANAEVAEVLTTAREALSKIEGSLFALARRDAGTVATLSRSLLTLANATSHGDTEATAVSTPSPPYLQHCLEVARRGRVPVALEWLCGGLLSTELEQELAQVNPFHGNVSQLRAELVLLMLLSNRSYFAEQSALAVRNVSLFLEFCELIRNVHMGDRKGSGATNPTAAPTKQRILELVQHFSLEIQPQTLAELMTQQQQEGDETAGGLVTLPDEVTHMLKGRAQQLLSAALDLITAKRFYTDIATPAGSAPGSFRFALDPRFLLFEFMFNILLRERQVEMVRWFVANIQARQSRVQQMIMGQGKTTVVGPLLALILADGTQLVTQVMPTALLEQTRGILRRCFSVVVVKHIYTLQFDRSFDDGGDGGDGGGIELIYQKLKSAEEDRSVVISAPECIKSLFLKEVEQLHMIDTVSTEDLNQELSSDERYATHATALRKKTIARSTMADAITPILQLWKRGVLIMDEVDVLLHPLRSELNFPIGLKHPIDMTGHRWLLPIHLLDAIFYFQRGRACEDVQRLLRLATSSLAATANVAAGSPTTRNDEAEQKEQFRAAALSGVRTSIAKGFAQRSLQREPHLVLLDVAYYESELLPALVPWLQLWLHEQILERLSKAEAERFPLKAFPTFCERTTDFLLSASKEDAATSPVAAYINTHLGGFGVKLLNLAHDWLHRLLPHVLSKIDRVSFGVLQPNDLALTSGGGGAAAVERIPFSRRMMAVPFVAKDVPSRSSEFAHPDVVIGLTVLAFRYEGLRLKDVRELVTQLKQDFARQAGPKEHRPAAKLYRRWLQLSSEDRQAIQANASASATADTPQKRMRRHMSSAALQERENSSSNLLNPVDAASSFERAGVPLSQLQVTDKAQLLSLHRILHRVPEVIHYYLCSCIFPRTMNFQNLKISACGHELGSSMLFTKRIGFSGTPSNLLPLDLGECFYEPGSDGRVLSVLTNPDVAHAEVLPDSWTPLKVLDRIAAAQPPLSALIDAGALITNMENEDVARYLLQRLPPSLFDGVVFLDSRDRQMILQRDNGLIVPVAQCGVSLSRRFTFFDQVHTTGTDVKQSSTATAVITLGKDLVFRDYAQGAYRMRGIGKGQRLCLYLIPEVISRIHEVLGPYKTGDMLRDVPAWLLLNSMKVEGLQFFKLSLQELANVWRKKAIRNLMRDAVYANAHADIFNGYIRSRRFHLPRPISEVALRANEEDKKGEAKRESKATTPRPLTEFDDVADPSTLPDIPLLKCSIQEFRETIEYPVASRVEAPKPFLTHLQELVEERPQELIEGDTASQALVDGLLERMQKSIQASKDAHAAAAASGTGKGENGKSQAHTGEQAHQTMDLNAEIVHEQEAEEEQEQEAEQEEQRISAFSRDDEFQVPWSVDTLRRFGADATLTERPTDGCCFFQMNNFQIRPSQPHLVVDPSLLMSDNYFRLDWHGVGERRLKTAFLFVEWIPTESVGELRGDGTDHICSGLITLAEGESLRWMLHHSQHTKDSIAAALRSVSTGRYMDASPLFSSMVDRSGVAALRHMPVGTQQTIAGAAPAHRVHGGLRGPLQPSRARATGENEEEDTTTATTGGAMALSTEAVAHSPDKAALLFRFFNNDMFFSDRQLQVLEYVLRAVSPEDRLQFFVECLRVRRRHRNHWEDAPIAALFVAPDDRANLRQLAVAKKVQLQFGEMLEVLVKAAKPRCRSSTRREANRIQEHLETFTASVSGAAQAFVSAGEEEGSAAAAGASACSPTSLPANQLALFLVEAFPKVFHAFSNYDVEQAILFATTKAREANGRLADDANEEAGSAEREDSINAKESKPVSLEDLFTALPLLDMHHVHLCVERGSTSPAPQPTAPLPPQEGDASAKIGGASGEVADSPWHCEVCTYLNEPSSRVCAMCMSPRPKPPASANPQAAPDASIEAHDGSDEEEDDVDGPWQCATCTFINDSRAQPLCAICLANNPNPLKEKQGAVSAPGGAGALGGGDLSWDCPEGYWVCSVEHGGCSKFNPNSVFYCQVCEKARPNLASVRF